MQAERPFRIVVVGAGVAGLVASNCLQRLGIDHIVLEKHAEVAPPMGNGISMWPHGLRVLHQLGYLPAIQRDAVPVNRFLSRGPDGRVMHDNLLYTLVEKKYVSPHVLLPLQSNLSVMALASFPWKGAISCRFCTTVCLTSHLSVPKRSSKM